VPRHHGPQRGCGRRQFFWKAVSKAAVARTGMNHWGYWYSDAGEMAK